MVPRAGIFVLILIATACGGGANQNADAPGIAGPSKEEVSASACAALSDAVEAMQTLLEGTDTGEEIQASLDESRESLSAASEDFAALGEPTFSEWTSDVADEIGRLQVTAQGRLLDGAEAVRAVTEAINRQPSGFVCP